MAARVLAQVVVAAGTVLFRAGAQAWGQALVNAQKSGVAQEATQKVASKLKGMSAQEAGLILGVSQDAPWGDVVKRYKHLFDVNEKHGSFYLQSKVYRAHEALRDEYKEDGRYTPEDEAQPGAGGPQQQMPPSGQEQKAEQKKS